ncbi:MAG: hypothetical protein HYU66_23920, partial [Armatimonadetes bacterium]|nr:hypothetical protein [Armatimonadota bacterium]
RIAAAGLACLAAAYAHDADRSNQRQLDSLKAGQRVLIGVHGVLSTAAQAWRDAERVRQAGTCHDTSLGFEYRRHPTVPTGWTAPLVTSDDDNMWFLATERSAAELAVFMAQVKARTGVAPDVDAHSQGSTILAKAARLIARVKAAGACPREYLALHLAAYEEWRALPPDVQAKVLDHAAELRQASVGVAVVLGSPTFVHDPAFDDLQALVDQRIPGSDHPAAFYVWSTGDLEALGVTALSHVPLGDRAEDGGSGFAADQQVFLPQTGHGGYWDSPGLDVLRDLHNLRRLSQATTALLRGEEPELPVRSGWVDVKPAGETRYVPVRVTPHSLIEGQPGEPLGPLAQDVVRRAVRLKQAGERPHVLVYGDGEAVETLAGWLERRGVNVVRRRDRVSDEDCDKVAELALQAGCAVAVVVSDSRPPQAPPPPLGSRTGRRDDYPDHFGSDPWDWPPPGAASGPLGDPVSWPGVSPEPRDREGATVPALALADAVADGKIEVIGAAREDAERGLLGVLRIRKLTDEPLRLVVPPGTALRSADPLTQSLVLP